MAPHAEDESIAIPQTPLLTGRNPGGGQPPQPIFTRSRLICALTVIFVIVFIIAIILIAVRAGDSSHEEALVVQDSKHANLESGGVPCVNNTHLQAAEQRQDDLQLSPEQLTRLKQLLEFIYDPKATNEMIKESKKARNKIDDDDDDDKDRDEEHGDDNKDEDDEEKIKKKALELLNNPDKLKETLKNMDPQSREELKSTLDNIREQSRSTTPKQRNYGSNTPSVLESRANPWDDDFFANSDDDFSINQMLESQDLKGKDTTPVPKAPTWGWNMAVKTTTTTTTQEPVRTKTRSPSSARAVDAFKILTGFQMPNTEDIRVPADYLENSWKEPSESEEGKVVYENMITLRDIESASEMEDTDLQGIYERTGKVAMAAGMARSVGQCQVNEIECANGVGCYIEEERCDRIMHCSDKSDELDCTCRQYISSDKLCDSFLDCKNGEDEDDCGCPKGQFNCGLETKCIPNSRVCDNIIDCENGLDESNCAALAPLSGGLLNPNVTGSPFIDGLVYWKVNQQFHPLCVDFPEPGMELQYFETMAEDICDSLLPGMMDEPPKVNLIQDLEKMKHISNVVHLELQGLEKVPGHKFLGGKFSFTVMPPDEKSTMAEITCPTPKCGVRASVKTAEGAILLATEPTTTTVVTEVNNDKIVGGKDADAKNWPSIVAIYRDGDFICGGTIINDEWVLTAAHCVENFRENQYYFDILVGMLRKNSKSSLQYSRKVVKVVIKEDFDSTYLKNDLALLKVDKPFIFNAYAGQACLPTSPDMSPQVGDVCYAAGWGNKREDRDPAEHLQEVMIPIMESCKKDYNNIELQICGGKLEGGIDSCQGDSGGPLFCQMPDDPNRWYLGGVISHGEGCARSDTPGVYTRVYAYTDWIADKLAEDASRDPGTGTELEPRLECPTHMCDGKCRKKFELCNQYVDCFDQTDELWCTKNNEDQIVFSPPTNEPREPDASPFVEPRQPTHTSLAYYPIIKHPVKTCKYGYFRCATVHQCIPQEKACDRVPDCVDFSDERSCTCSAFLSRKDKNRACDGYPDCKNWEDERNCKFCDDNHFFCDLSRECIPRHKVCDTKADCRFKEDERYCFTLINTNSVWLQQDGRPKKQTTGILAFSSKGLWAASCVQTWTAALSDQICRYMGYKFAVTHTQHSSDSLPHLKGQVLTIRYQDGQKSVFPRSFDSYLEEKQALSDDERVKRQAKSCSFVHLECSETPACGIMPLYDRLGEQAPLAGPGVFPWQVTLYKQGQYFCGASLVHQYWVLTSTVCADMTDVKGGDYIIARAGGHREQFSLSAHDQLRRVVQFTTIPGTNISMGFLSAPFTLTEHVNIVCIPSVTWTPINRTCYITGRYNGVLNHAYQTTVDLVCDYIPNKQYSFCTKQRYPTNECLEQWSGALVCPDNSGTYYAVGGYYSGQANCKFGSERAPDRFETLVSQHAREGITSVIKSAEADKHPFKNIPDNCDTLRCPLGRCLSPHEICDGVIHCSNMADEAESLCENKIRMCEHVNRTHCACLSQDFQCGNGMCLAKTKFCNGVNDCGDDLASDEPENCHTCAVALQTLNPKAVCNGNVDCVGKNDIGEDESAATCCPNLPGGLGSNSSSVNASDTFRCVIGELSAGSSYHAISISDECIPSTGVCDWDTNATIPRCGNGADELDCIAIWPQYHVKEHPKDPFGRFISAPKGYLYFVAFGKKFLYCAGLQTFKPTLINSFGEVLCRKKGFRGAISITLSVPQSRSRVAPEIALTGEEEAHYQACHLVYLTCRQEYGY